MKIDQETLNEYSDKAVALRDLIDKQREFAYPSFIERVVMNHLTFIVMKTLDSSFIEVTWCGKVKARINVGSLLIRCPSLLVKGKVIEYFLEPNTPTPIPVVADIISEYIAGCKR